MGVSTPRALTALALLTLAAPAQEPAAPLKVACLGDSITYGSAMGEGVVREHASYPAQLGAMLGAAYEVRNFGVGGTTLLTEADRPYVETQAWRDALAWKPDLAIVALGTNDSCDGPARNNWQHASGLVEDATAMVGELREAGVERVLLCGPTGMQPGASGLSEARLADLTSRAPHLGEVRAALIEVAAGLPLVEYHDLGRVLTAGQTTDGVHPTPFGAEAVALRMASVVDPTPTPGLEPFHGRLGELSEQAAAQRSTYLGYPREDFRLPDAGVAATLVRPHAAAPGAPWLWRMRFWGHEPELERQLLERGWHLAYVDIAGLYGAPEAMTRMDELYALLRDEVGLHPRPALLGMSRGGLPAAWWAVRRGSKASSVILDNPVIDLNTWPGGDGGKRSDADWEAALAAYGWTEQEMDERGRELPLLAGSAPEGTPPILMVLGLQDEVVPAAANGLRFLQGVRWAGGAAELWTKPADGHHPHGLHPPDPLVRAVEHAFGSAHNPALLARPSVEHRGHAAGWGGGTWMDQVDALVTTAKADPDLDLVLLGDSITQGLTGSSDRRTHPGGTREVDAAFGDLSALNLGLSGDRTSHVLWRIEHGALAHTDPRVIVLQLGANNLNAAGHSPRETLAGLDEVLASLAEHEPQAKVVLCGPFPLGTGPHEERRHRAAAVHDELPWLLEAHPAVRYLDLWPRFLDDDGQAEPTLASDGIHVTAAGREAWMRALAPVVRELLEE